jgi:hypothetical protein
MWTILYPTRERIKKEVTQQFGVREERMYAVDLEIWTLTLLNIFKVKSLYLKFTSLLFLVLAQNPSEIGTHKFWFSASQALLTYSKNKK